MGDRDGLRIDIENAKIRHEWADLIPKTSASEN
jgi:hypothetical protein